MGGHDMRSNLSSRSTASGKNSAATYELRAPRVEGTEWHSNSSGRTAHDNFHAIHGYPNRAPRIDGFGSTNGSSNNTRGYDYPSNSSSHTSHENFMGYDYPSNSSGADEHEDRWKGSRGQQDERRAKGGSQKGQDGKGRDGSREKGGKGKGKEVSRRSPANFPRAYVDGTLESTQRMWDLYVKQGDNRGQTLMWHGLPSRCNAASDLLPRLEEIQLLDKLQYLYMPVDGDNQFRMNGSRGKGYAFLHFFDLDAVDAMMKRAEEGLHVSSRRETSLAVASYQGISANLQQILSSPMIASMKGHFFGRVEGQLEKLYIQDLLTVHTQGSSAGQRD
jgi:hypothetical protein